MGEFHVGTLPVPYLSRDIHRRVLSEGIQEHVELQSLSLHAKFEVLMQLSYITIPKINLTHAIGGQFVELGRVSSQAPIRIIIWTTVVDPPLRIKTQILQGLGLTDIQKQFHLLT